MNKRIYEFDIIRVFAMLLIMVYHIPGNVQSIYSGTIYYSLSIPFIEDFAFWGLSLFFFIAGFLLYHYSCKDFNGLKIFFINKVIRLIPLYWLCLFVNYLVFAVLKIKSTRNVDFSITSIVIQMLGLQFSTLLPGTYFVPGMWYIGALILFMVIFAIVSFVTKNRIYTIFGLLLLVAPITLIKTSFLLDSVSLYYPMFVIGVSVGIVYSAGAFKPRINKVPRIIRTLSYAQYPAYLFHGVIYVTVVQLLYSYGLLNDILLAIISIPLSFMAGYILQYSYDHLILRLSSNTNVKVENV